MDDYYDIDAILSENSAVPVALQTDVQRLGFLVNKPTSTVIKKGTDGELPFWAAKVLCSHDLIRISSPKTYSIDVQNDLYANPTSVNLHNLNPYFHSFGLQMLPFYGVSKGNSGEQSKLLSSLLRSLALRFKWIVDNSNVSSLLFDDNPTSSSVGELSKEEMKKVTDRLSVLEMSLFSASLHSTQEIADWKKGKTNELFVPKSVKRKRETKLFNKT